MKIFILTLSICLSCSLSAQKNIFIRIYDLKGKKINKGLIFMVTDTSVQLKKNFVIIPVSNIGSIKTKHSIGNNFLVGSLIGASALAILGFISADPDAFVLAASDGEGAATGALVGLAAGAIIGGLTIPAKNPKTFLIDGDSMKWKTFQTWVSKKNSLLVSTGSQKE